MHKNKNKAVTHQIIKNRLKTPDRKEGRSNV